MRRRSWSDRNMQEEVQDLGFLGGGFLSTLLGGGRLQTLFLLKKLQGRYNVSERRLARLAAWPRERPTGVKVFTTGGLLRLCLLVAVNVLFAFFVCGGAMMAVGEHRTTEIEEKKKSQIHLEYEDLTSFRVFGAIFFFLTIQKSLKVISTGVDGCLSRVLPQSVDPVVVAATPKDQSMYYGTALTTALSRLLYAHVCVCVWSNNGGGLLP